jgi:hypothetical protein
VPIHLVMNRAVVDGEFGHEAIMKASGGLLSISDGA